MDLELLIQRLFAAETPEARSEILSEIEDPAAIAAEARTVGADLLAGDITDEALASVEALAQTNEWVAEEIARRETLAAEAAQTVADLRDRLGVDPPAPEGDEPDPALAAGDEPDPAGDEPDPAPAEGDPAPVTGEPTAAVTEPEPEPAAPAAAAPQRRTPNLAALRDYVPAANQPVDEPAGPGTRPVRVQAGPDLPSFSPGSEIVDVDALAQAMIERRESLGNSSGGDKVRVARMNYQHLLTLASEDPNQNALLLAKAALPTALTASGGFCAPSENVYNFIKVNSPEDLVQGFLPTMGAPRGAVNFPTSPDIRDAFALPTSHAYTEQNDIDSVHKTTTVIPCPEWAECTVEAQYDILQFGNFAARALPEWVTHWTGLSMDVHDHLVSAKLAAKMVTLSNAAINVLASGGATATLLSFANLAGADYRQDLRMPRAAPLDMMVPSWTYAAIRADLVRSGAKTELEALMISDAQINSWFAVNNLTLRPVTDWQGSIGGTVDTGASTFPQSLTFLVFAPGTFVRLDMGTLDLGLVRDSTLNQTNDYNIFVESFETVCKPGLESRAYTIELCVNGEFSSLGDLTCSGASHGAS